MMQITRHTRGSTNGVSSAVFPPPPMQWNCEGLIPRAVLSSKAFFVIVPNKFDWGVILYFVLHTLS